MDTATDIFIGDGIYRAWLPLPQAIELERKCGFIDRDGRTHPKSLFALYAEIGDNFGKDENGDLVFLGGGMSLATQINDTVRLGLIGGNSGPEEGGSTDVGPQRAKLLVDTYGFPARPLNEVAALAWKILHAAIVGIDVKKKASKPQAKRRSRSTKVAQS